MSAETLKFDEFECPSPEIAAYIDGELDSARELEFEQHIAACDVCSAELNYQKRFLCTLNLSLKHENELELPANFAETVIAKAESSVTGLRRPRERFNAIFICAALSLFVLFALGADAGNLFAVMTNVFEKMVAVIGFFVHIVYSFFIGAGVVMRTLGGQFLIPVAVSFIIFTVFVALFLVFSRMLLRSRRT